MCSQLNYYKIAPPLHTFEWPRILCRLKEGVNILGTTGFRGGLRNRRWLRNDLTTRIIARIIRREMTPPCRRLSTQGQSKKIIERPAGHLRALLSTPEATRLLEVGQSQYRSDRNFRTKWKIITQFMRAAACRRNKMWALKIITSITYIADIAGANTCKYLDWEMQEYKVS